MTREQVTLGLLLASTFAIRAIHPGQPIVENYVGRQIPTAMVARNLERGSGFLHPQLDTGPFPNLFLVEPPIYAQVVVAVRPILGFDLEPTGRLVSAAATTLAAWGLFGLARRREGSNVALLALASFSMFPVMIRYGRAFQPDALMLGCVLAGLQGWDEYEDRGDWRWAAFGGFVFSVGLALKVTVAWTLLPFALIVRRKPLAWRLGVAVTMLAPALAWYVHAWGEVARSGSGSLAASDTAGLWLQSLSPAAWLRLTTYDDLGRGLLVRSFTPVGFVLSAWGLLASGRVDRLWRGWAIGCSLAIFGLAAKWHHAYYWMAVAPLAAIGVARGLAKVWGLGKVGRPVSAALASFFFGLCLVQSASTWRTPEEWASLVEAARVTSLAAPNELENLIAAPEALLYYADRRGFRLEFDPEAVRRAVGEWGAAVPDPGAPMALVEFYRREGTGPRDRPGGRFARVSHVADVGPAIEGPRRRAFRNAIRADPRCKILIDRPGMLVAELR